MKIENISNYFIELGSGTFLNQNQKKTKILNDHA